MSSWFNTTDSLEHISPLPAGLSPEKAIKTLHDHIFYIKADPHMIKYEAITPPSGVEPVLPDDIRGLAKGGPTYFSVTDKVHTLPAGLWDSDVVSTYEFFNLEKGVFVRIRSPMGVVMESVWDIREGENGGFVLVESVLIKASRLLIGTVRSMCDAEWEEIHKSMFRMMKETP